MKDDMHKHISFKFQYCCKIKSNFPNREPTLEKKKKPLTHTIQHKPFTKMPTKFSPASPVSPAATGGHV